MRMELEVNLHQRGNFIPKATTIIGLIRTFFEICHLRLSPVCGASVSHTMIVSPRMFFREASVSGEAAGSGGERWGHAGIRGVPQAERRSPDTGVGFHPDLCSSTGGARGGVITSSLHCSWTVGPHQCKRESFYSSSNKIYVPLNYVGAVDFPSCWRF